ncbi:MAG: hypothetical protein U0X87_05815 [Anaerolineales bacterium]
MNGERFSIDAGTVEHFERHFDLHTGVLTRTVGWRSPSGNSATIVFERFASLADQHLLCIRCRVTPEFDGTVEIRASLNGNMDNDMLIGNGSVKEKGMAFTIFIAGPAPPKLTSRLR